VGRSRGETGWSFGVRDHRDDHELIPLGRARNLDRGRDSENPADDDITDRLVGREDPVEGFPELLCAVVEQRVRVHALVDRDDEAVDRFVGPSPGGHEDLRRQGSSAS
jgi:hypothetical protein